MKQKNKRGLSDVVIAVLLIVMSITVAAIVYNYSKNALQDAKREGAVTFSKTECPKKFNMQYDACYDLASNTIKINIVNLNEEIPAGSQISLKGEYSTVLALLYSDPKTLKGGESGSIIVDASISDITLSNFGLKEVKIIPIFTIENNKVLCNELESVIASECK